MSHVRMLGGLYMSHVCMLGVCTCHMYACWGFVHVTCTHCNFPLLCNRLLEKYEIYEQDPANYFKSVHSMPPAAVPTVNIPSTPALSSTRSALHHLPSSHDPTYSHKSKVVLPPLLIATFNASALSLSNNARLTSGSLATSSLTGSSSATPTRDKVGYDRLARSLLSGYPNEVDLVLNVLTVLAYKAPGALPTSEVRTVYSSQTVH